MTLRILSLPIFLLILSSVGCGPSYNPVAGIVTLDGAPVDRATVTFVAADGKTSYSGVTDDSGNFTLASGEQVGAPAGTYKVLVTKYKEMKGTDGMNATDPEYLKLMQKNMKETAKSSAPKMIAPGMMAPPGTSGFVGEKSLLKADYASLDKTPVTVKVPLESSPVKIELKK